jgi:excisionase family DNA binding protein
MKTEKAQSASNNARPQFLTVAELAELLRVKPRTIYEMVSQKKIPYRKVGRRVVFLLAEILEWTNPDAGLIQSHKRLDGHVSRL